MTVRTPKGRIPRNAPPPKCTDVIQVLIVLMDTNPLVWRRIEVPANYSFWDLHVAIQDSMGWQDYHLHEFRCPQFARSGIRTIGIPDDEGFEKPSAPGWDIGIDVYASGYSSMPIEYVYDFGDDWRHLVAFEGKYRRSKRRYDNRDGASFLNIRHEKGFYMFKQLAIVLCMVLVTLLPGAHATELRAQDKPTSPLYPTVFLKPGEAQQVVLFAPEFLVGAHDRTAYDITPVSEKGDKTSALKGITIDVDRQRMVELLDHYGDHCLAVKFSSTADAEPGKFMVRVRALRFGGLNYFETTVRLTVAK